MMFETNDDRTAIKFNTLLGAEVFRDERGLRYLRLCNPYAEPDKPNAVNLITGILVHIQPDSYVWLVKGKFVEE